MEYNLIITRETREDILNAWLYYEDIQQGLGDRFQTEVYEKMNIIAKQPEHYSFLGYDNKNLYRFILLGRFPYKIIFEVSNSEVAVFGVVHVKRHPSFILRRLHG